MRKIGVDHNSLDYFASGNPFNLSNGTPRVFHPKRPASTTQRHPSIPCYHTIMAYRSTSTWSQVSKQELHNLIDWSSTRPMKDEDDVADYFDDFWALGDLVLPRLGSEPARRAEAGRFATRLTGPILGKVAVPMTVDST